MTCTQRQNRLTTHFSERIPIVKWHISVSLYPTSWCQISQATESVAYLKSFQCFIIMTSMDLGNSAPLLIRRIVTTHQEHRHHATCTAKNILHSLPWILLAHSLWPHYIIKRQIESSSLGLISHCFLCSELHIPEGFEHHLRSNSSLCEMTMPEGLYEHQISRCELGLLSEPYPSVQFQTRLQAPQDPHCRPLLPHINNPSWPSANASCQVHIYSAIQT